MSFYFPVAYPYNEIGGGYHENVNDTNWWAIAAYCSKCEESIEETARLLAQATIGEGRVIIAGFDEMDVVRLAATVRG